MSGTFEKTIRAEGGILINARSLGAIRKSIGITQDAGIDSTTTPVDFSISLANGKKRNTTSFEEFDSYTSENGGSICGIRIRAHASNKVASFALSISEHDDNYSELRIDIEAEDEDVFYRMESACEALQEAIIKENSWLQTTEISTIGFWIFCVSSGLISILRSLRSNDSFTDLLGDAIAPALLVGFIGAIVVSRIRRAYFNPIEVTGSAKNKMMESRRSLIVNSLVSILIAAVAFYLGKTI